MKKAQILKIVNICLVILFVNQSISGILRPWISSTFSYELVEILHNKAGYVFVTCALVHLYLNWNWIVLNILKSKPKKKVQET